MVCLGNICRSPLAEGIMKAQIELNNLDWEVDSAGTSSYHEGEKPDRRSVQVAREHGLDITNQRAQQFQAAHLDQYDLIFAMDAQNNRDILSLATTTDQKEKVKLILNMVDPGQNQGVPDPYWDDNGFEKVYQMLDLACEKIIEKYK